LMRKSPV